MPTVDTYIIQRSLTGTDNWVSVGTVSGATTTFSDAGLDLDTTYYYRVIAQNDEGVSAPSNVANATTASGAFDPNSISDLVSWLDASVTSSMQDPFGVPVVTSDGDVFNRWAETIATTPTASHWRASTSNDLKWYASINGFPAVESLRVASPYIQTQTATNDPQQLPSGEQQTIFAVSTNTTSGGRGVVIGTSGSFGSNDGGIVLTHDRRTSSQSQGFAENIFGGFAFPSGTPALDNDNIRVGAIRLDKAGGEVQTWTNGTANTPAALSGTYWQDGRQGYLGEAFPGYTADIFIHETLVYDRALSDSEVGEVNDYLKAKYGL